MEDQISEQVKAKRSALMISLGERKRQAYEESFIGSEVEVLVEEPDTINGKEVQTGHTKEYIKVALESGEDLRNQIVKIRIDNASQIIR